ncbi:virion morphogenesis protein [Aeromonas phage Gekk3-15]
MKDLSKALKSMHGRSVEAGWFESAKYSDGTPVAAVAAWNELGTPDANYPIPPRPFMRKALMDANATIDQRLQRDVTRMLEGDFTPDQVLARVGQHYVSSIVDSIKNGNWQGNSDATIANKGFDKPLIHSGDMWKEATFNVT